MQSGRNAFGRLGTFNGSETPKQRGIEIMKAYATTNPDRLIDTIDNTSGLTSVFAETLEQVRQRYPDAQVVDIDEWCAEKQRQQLTPITWAETDEETYWDMLECLPPARMAGGAFLVGEPMDHLASTGENRFEMYRKQGSKFFVASRPVTIAEFNHIVVGAGRAVSLSE